MSVYICRHGDRQTLHLHSRLSTLGKEQARDLGRVLAQQNIACPFVMSSVYDRCLETSAEISRELGCVPIRVEHGLSEGPVSCVQPFPTSEFLEHEYPQIDATCMSHTPPPEAEHDQHDVLPRCEQMAEYISSLYTVPSRTPDLVVVTHGTVAIGLAACMVRRPHETVHDSIARLQGCAPAGFYKIVQSSCASCGSSSWQTDGVCVKDHLSVEARNKGTRTTPTCYIPPFPSTARSSKTLRYHRV